MYTHLGWHFPDVDKHFVQYVKSYPETHYQQTSIDEALKYVKNFKCAVDVGANIGLHSVRFSSLFESVHSYEPTSLNYECLEKNTEELKNVHLNKFGLGSQFSKESIKLPTTVENCGGFSIVEWDNCSDETIEEIIDIKTLDSLNLKPDLIKIDVQGFDLNVLQGSLKTLIACRPVIIIEAESKKHKRDITNFLEPLGFISPSQVRKDQIWIYNE